MAGRSDHESWRSALAVASVGVEMAVAVIVGWGVGSWLDGKLGTSPWMMYLWLVLGIAAAFRGLWRTARKHWPKDGAT